MGKSGLVAGGLRSITSARTFAVPKPDYDDRPMTTEEIIAHQEATGAIVRDCPGCAEFFVNPGAFAPRHKASNLCRSGKRPHCTCDACF